MKIKAVGFDIDGTLYPDSSMYLYSILAVLRHPILFSHFGRIRKKIRTMEYDGNIRSIQAGLMSVSLGIDKKRAEELIERHIYGQLSHAFKRIKPYPNLRPVLLSLKGEGLRLGALSDLPVGRKLDYLGIDDLMDVAFSSEETGFLKPNEIPFKRLIKEFGVLPGEILYVGNNYTYDVLGAAALGIRTAHLTLKPVPDSQADFTFSSFIALRDWIFTINN